MKRHEGELLRLVRSYAAERISFWGFHEEFLSRWTRLPAEARSELSARGWNEIYASVLTAIPDPVSEEDGARGVIGETELRSRLRGHPFLSPPGRR